MNLLSVLAGGFGKALVALSLLAAVSVAAANGDGIAQLRQFVAEAASASGRFEQVVTASSGRRPQTASGAFAFERPGRFRWVYEAPYPQLLVSDGERLWIWDEDLNQVTVRVLGDALGNTPAAILAGEGALERDFALSEAGRADDLDWVLAVPHQADGAFESMRVGLAHGRLKRMEMRDHFGQTTVIDFSTLVIGVELDEGLFSFVPPPGADIIGD